MAYEQHVMFFQKWGDVWVVLWVYIDTHTRTSQAKNVREWNSPETLH